MKVKGPIYTKLVSSYIKFIDKESESIRSVSMGENGGQDLIERINDAEADAIYKKLRDENESQIALNM